MHSSGVDSVRAPRAGEQSPRPLLWSREFGSCQPIACVTLRCTDFARVTLLAGFARGDVRDQNTTPTSTIVSPRLRPPKRFAFEI